MGRPAGRQPASRLWSCVQLAVLYSDGDARPTDNQGPGPGDRCQHCAHHTPDEHPDAASHWYRHRAATGNDRSSGGNCRNPAYGYRTTPYPSAQ